MKFRFRKTNDNQHEREILLKSEFQINVDDILKSWAEEWSETPATCTQKWKLSAINVLADGTIALLFEYPVNYYEGSVDNYEEHVVTNYYRVLMYDPKKKKLIGKYRFSVYWGFATTVFFKNGCLYAVIAPFSKDEKYMFTALHMWPGADDEHQIYLGENVSCAAARSNGDVIVCYDKDSEIEVDEGVFSGMIFLTNGEFRGIPCFTDTNKGRTHGMGVFTLDSEERIWGLLYDMRTVVCCEHDGSYTKYRISDEDAENIAVPDDAKGLYFIYDDIPGYGLGYMPINGDTKENSVSCVLRTKTGEVRYFENFSFLKGTAAFLADGTVHVANLNRRRFR